MTPAFTRQEQLQFFDDLPSRVNYHIWGVQYDAQIVGAAGLKNFRGDTAEYWGYIGVKGLWGRGLGRRMVEQVESKARELGVAALDLKVAASNPRAIALYRKMGYAVVAGDDNGMVLRMLKALP